MTREEIIKGLGEISVCQIWEDEVIDEAIKALEQEPSRNMEEIAEVIKSDVDAETKCKMISNILTAKPHYFEKQTIQDKQAESEKYQKAFDDGYANGYAQARFDYEQEPIITTNNDEPIFINYPIITCDDAVSREAVDDILCLYSDKNGMIDTREAVRMVLELPSVTQKSGKWIDYDSLDDTVARLNKEGWEITRYEYKRIQGVLFEMATNCGAKMESEVQTE